MSEDSYYITPHEAALAVVATSMKKARLRLDTLAINSIVGGVLFSAGGMLHLLAQAENPDLWKTNPGIVHLLQGAFYPIGLFYVIIMGAELYNSNILYFSVGVCRGAVTILDLVISWFVSYFFNLGANLFVCYVICNLSGVTQSELFVSGSIQIVKDKVASTFIQTFIKAAAGNFAVCLAVYLQLLAKPIHVKLIVLSLPIFTFVSMGFTHAVADMYLVPMGMINGAPLSVGKCIWKLLVPAALGNAVGGSTFGIVIPFYLHLVVVERDRKLLNLPKYDARDEQPELEMDSRVVRVPTEKEEEELDSSDTDDQINSDQLNPVMYRPQERPRLSASSRSSGNLSRVASNISRITNRTNNSIRSPPGVFPVKGMGRPLSREKSIASRNDVDDITEPQDEESISSEITDIDARSTMSKIGEKERNKMEEEEYIRDGGYNARDNYASQTLRKVFTRAKSTTGDLESGLGPDLKPAKTVPSISPSSHKTASSGQGNIFRSISRSLTQSQPNTAKELSRRLSAHSITPKAANASDNIAGIDNYDICDAMQRPKSTYNRRPSSHRQLSYTKSSLPRMSEHHMSHDNDYFEQQSVASNH